ncbi:glycosyltransferase family 2 protein [Fibrobacter sp. UWB13]|uniref:glycosyltransferase family 2 protein n=1 Tax=Fibrobacter sp. UWB13 TaxID=1896204 RepID=UPI000A0AEC97|nr:glycosyltransferase family 2 protein [Fibrobacter sp. UWB13]SMG22671.1 Glycosyltransferase, GT2 family [Fibrobacter sp. UWB13]
MPKISCVILNYNDVSTTIKLVERIKNYTIIDFLVVVDNCSTDDSWSLLQCCKNDKVHVIQSPKNGGYGAGNNLGLHYSSDVLNVDYSIIANPDVFFDEDCVEKFLKTFLDEQSVAVVSARQSNSPDCAWKNCTTLQYVLATSLFFEVWLKIRSYPKKYFKDKESVTVFAVPGSLLMVDLKKMLKYGMYDEEFFLYYEEPVLAHKFDDAGLKTVLRLDCSYQHNHHVSISKTYRRWSQQHAVLLKSADLFLRKYKKANALQMTFAKLWFAYTKLEFWLYDLFCVFKSSFDSEKENAQTTV